MPGFELGEIENLVDQPGQTFGFADDDAEEARPLGKLEARIVVQHFGKGADRGQRRAQFVRHGRDEIVLHAVDLAQTLICGAQFAGRRFQFALLVF